MTTYEQELILRLAHEDISPEEFLNLFRNSNDGVALAGELLDEAIASRNGVDVEMALLVGFTFGFKDEHIPSLSRLAAEDWHERHEDVVGALSSLRSLKTVDALFHATQWIPPYLTFDKSRALAVKAIWALGNLDGIKAEGRLRQLAETNAIPLLRNEAQRQLSRRKT
ncbi:MAG: hypothetical protein K0R17_530 [Rariglobus sp.]|jgi:hypothetical protein|nr:hypothetical protein [Rariglobus sp.]